MQYALNPSRRPYRVLVAACVALSLATTLLGTARTEACPFCSAVSLTLTEEINTADLAVIAKIAEGQALPSTDSIDAPAQASKTKFEIVEVLKGQEHVEPGDVIEVFYFGQDANQPEFLITAIDPKMPSWGTPIGLSEKAGAYVRNLLTLPAKGADRLAYFQDYFEDADPILAADAYDEFAKAPYAEVQELKDRMPHEKLLAWIQNPEVTATRKRLYLTMLGVCGTREDVPVLQNMIESDDRQLKTALDAVVACYLILEGPDGLPLVEDRFLKNKEAEYTDTYAVIMALRFHGQEVDVIPQERLVGAMRHMLDRPQLADLVIADLARWQDWESMPKLVELFKGANEESGWVRVPVVNFLRACPLPEAQTYLSELAEIDPDAVKRASSFLPLAAEPTPPPAPAPSAPAAEITDATASAPALPAEPAMDESQTTSATTGNEDETAAAPVASQEPDTADSAPDGDGNSVANLPTTPSAASPPAAVAGNSTWSWPVFLAPIVVAAVLVILLMVIFRGQRGRAAT